MSRSQRDILAVGVLVLLASVAFVRLMAVPVFEDEGSQLRYISRLIGAGEWLQPLSEGKPLEAWPMVPFMWLAQPLAGIRAVHVAVGAIGAVLIWRLAILLGANRWTAFTCGALFALCPFAVYLERLALSDILLCTAGIWVLLSALKFLESPARPHALSLAAALVLAACCKLPVGFVFLLSMPLALALMPSSERRQYLYPPARRWLLAAHAPVLLLALVVALAAIVRWQRGQPPGFGIQDLVGIGLGAYRINLPRPTLLGELATQLSWPVVILGVIGVAVSAVARDWRLRWLIAVAGLPLLAIGLVARFWYPRYLLFTLPPLIVAAVFGWEHLAQHTGRWRRVSLAAVLLVTLACLLPQSARLIFEPQAARWSAIDRYQYFDGPGSGYGYPEAASCILGAEQAPRTIYSLDGHSAEQLRTYLPPAWRSRVSPLAFAADGSVLRSNEARLQNLLTPDRVWLIVPEPLLHTLLESNVGADNAARLRVRQLAAFSKPDALTRIALYEVAKDGSESSPTTSVNVCRK
jgi:hypothetical protein